jgi:hypothetical protein
MAGASVLAVQISRHGGPEELVLTEVPDPVAAAGQVVVRNSWIGVNYVDLQHHAGRPYPVQLPLIPGTEAAAVPVEFVVPLAGATGGAVVQLAAAAGAPFDPGRLSGITGAGRGAGSLTLLSPRIAGRFPLHRAAEAHARLASRTVLGKLLLQA